MRPAADTSVVLLDGPWEHRWVAANGARFHVAQAGDGPLVVLLHGFPQFWWTWRGQLASLAAAGYRAVAMDLRGYGGSDKPPRGYDPMTLCADVAGVVRSLGHADAVIVGSDWGGLLAWTAAVLHPGLVRGIGVVGMPHPRRMRAAVGTDPHQLRASRYVLSFQPPVLPERALVRHDAARVEQLLRAWGAPGWPDPATAATYRGAARLPGTAYSAMEYYRWAVRSVPRPDGVRYTRAMRAPVRAPVLHVHGALDRCVLPASAVGSERYVDAPYRWRLLESAGHFPHEERPARFDAELLRWLADVDPSPSAPPSPPSSP